MKRQLSLRHSREVIHSAQTCRRMRGRFTDEEASQPGRLEFLILKPEAAIKTSWRPHI
jgi:hypothetical protein